MSKEKRIPAHSDLSAGVDERLGDFGLRRRTFLQILGSGLLITVTHPRGAAQARGSSTSVAARLLLNELQP